MRRFFGALRRQCPNKHLEWLSPVSLRGALEGAKQTLPINQARKMDEAELPHCKLSEASFVNGNALVVNGRDTARLS